MDPFVAEVRIFAFNFAPTGWAFCDGQLLRISQNTALFSLVGTAYGGDGKSTFGLPNLQGQAAMSQGQGPGLSNYWIGESVGVETVTLADSEIPSHKDRKKKKHQSREQEQLHDDASAATTDVKRKKKKKDKDDEETKDAKPKKDKKSNNDYMDVW